MAAKNKNKLQILIVDDDKDILDITCDFLESKGYKVLQASTGKEALKATQTSKPNLILLDVMMPKMDGFWLCRVIKSDPKLQNIPIIFLTAKDDAQSRIEGQKCGGDDYLTKPFDLDALDLRIKAQLKRMSKGDIVAKLEKILGIPRPGGFLAKLNHEELTTLLERIEAKIKAK